MTASRSPFFTCCPSLKFTCTSCPSTRLFTVTVFEPATFPKPRKKTGTSFGVTGAAATGIARADGSCAPLPVFAAAVVREHPAASNAKAASALIHLTFILCGSLSSFSVRPRTQAGGWQGDLHLQSLRAKVVGFDRSTVHRDRA